MKLIADCGSTKVDWCIVSDEKKVVKQVFTSGMNAVMLTREEIAQRIELELLPEIDRYKDGITEIYYYGAGCLSEKICGNVGYALRANFPEAHRVEVYTDLLAAARAVCGKKSGIACILGTGSNSCYYDGEKIVKNVSPLGYILGDEGSGAVLGKYFLGDILKNQMSEKLRKDFLEDIKMTVEEIISRVYRQPEANRFLASLTPFIYRNLDEPKVRERVVECFRSFFFRNIRQYNDYGIKIVDFVGSIAYYFRNELETAAAAEGFAVGEVLKSPMEGLVKYHC